MANENMTIEEEYGGTYNRFTGWVGKVIGGGLAPITNNIVKATEQLPGGLILAALLKLTFGIAESIIGLGLGAIGGAFHLIGKGLETGGDRLSSFANRGMPENQTKEKAKNLVKAEEKEKVKTEEKEKTEEKVEVKENVKEAVEDLSIDTAEVNLQKSAPEGTLQQEAPIENVQIKDIPQQEAPKEAEQVKGNPVEEVPKQDIHEENIPVQEGLKVENPIQEAPKAEPVQEAQQDFTLKDLRIAQEKEQMTAAPRDIYTDGEGKPAAEGDILTGRIATADAEILAFHEKISRGDPVSEQTRKELAEHLAMKVFDQQMRKDRLENLKAGKPNTPGEVEKKIQKCIHDPEKMQKVTQNLENKISNYLKECDQNKLTILTSGKPNREFENMKKFAAETNRQERLLKEQAKELEAQNKLERLQRQQENKNPERQQQQKQNQLNENQRNKGQQEPDQNRLNQEQRNQKQQEPPEKQQPQKTAPYMMIP